MSKYPQIDYDAIDKRQHEALVAALEPLEELMRWRHRVVARAPDDDGVRGHSLTDVDIQLGRCLDAARALLWRTHV